MCTVLLLLTVIMHCHILQILVGGDRDRLGKVGCILRTLGLEEEEGVWGFEVKKRWRLGGF